MNSLNACHHQMTDLFKYPLSRSIIPPPFWILSPLKYFGLLNWLSLPIYIYILELFPLNT